MNPLMSAEPIKAIAEGGCGCARGKVEEVADAGAESFPANDPPAWTGGQKPEPASAKACCCSGIVRVNSKLPAGIPEQAGPPLFLLMNRYYARRESMPKLA
jgi:hypothetical protein